MSWSDVCSYCGEHRADCVCGHWGQRKATHPQGVVIGYTEEQMRQCWWAGQDRGKWYWSDPRDKVPEAPTFEKYLQTVSPSLQEDVKEELERCKIMFENMYKAEYPTNEKAAFAWVNTMRTMAEIALNPNKQ